MGEETKRGGCWIKRRTEIDLGNSRMQKLKEEKKDIKERSMKVSRMRRRMVGGETERGER